MDNKGIKIDGISLSFEFHMTIIYSGGSRISQRGVRQLQRWGHQPIIFANFLQKLHEIEEIWIKRGERVPGAPPPDPPMIYEILFI